MYGTECHNAYDGSMPDHQARLHKVVTHADGRLYVPGAFSRIIPKVIPSQFNVVTSPQLVFFTMQGTLVTEEQEFRANFICMSTTRLSVITSGILSYQGAEQNPRWTDKEMGAYPAEFQRYLHISDDQEGKFSTLCRVHAHLPPKVSLKQKGAQGSYFMATCDVVLLFGLTELKAQLSWKENVCLHSFRFDWHALNSHDDLIRAKSAGERRSVASAHFVTSCQGTRSGRV